MLERESERNKKGSALEEARWVDGLFEVDNDEEEHWYL